MQIINLITLPVQICISISHRVNFEKKTTFYNHDERKYIMYITILFESPRRRAAVNH